ncbi:MAG TPA: TSUP family transporter [Clostridia bacterium]|nr:TSUP family transporter [Clostridia bacterium]
MDFEISFINIIFLCIAGFTASAVDAIAGGGGLINLPAILAAGVPPHFALGTNKFASSFGAFTSAYTFTRSGKVFIPLMKITIPCTLAGSVIGVLAALRIDQGFLQLIILVLIFATAIYTIVKKDFGSEDRFEGLTRKNKIQGCMFAFALGFYDGFFGPGTGSFLIFLFIRIYGFDFTIAAGNSKVLNFVSNITSLVMFAINGKIYYMLGIPIGIAMIAGARVGSSIAIKNGAKVIKPIFVTIALVLALKLLSDIFL